MRVAVFAMFGLAVSLLFWQSSTGSSLAKARAVAPRTAVATPERARWRLAAPGELHRVVLWMSHILIRHQRSDRQFPIVVGWIAEPPPPSRTRRDALALARSIAQRATSDPSSFATLARTYSEDVVTAATGGSLGGVSATALLLESGVLDAMASMKPGDVSGVIETRQGFEIFLRRPVPPRVTLAARRIVVPYDTDGEARFGHAARSIGRSRADALQLAQTAAEEIRRDNPQLDRFLAQFPQPPNAEADGAIGAWTNLEPGPFEREREQLALLQPGEVTDPIDSPDGFEVFLRTPASSVVEYAATTIKFVYSAGAAPGSSENRETVLKQAQAVAKSLAADPRRFEDLQSRSWFPDVQRCTRGRSPIPLFEAVVHLPIGGITKAPLEYDSSFVLAKRVDPVPSSDPAPLFELPAPTSADVAGVALNASGPAAQKFIRKLGEDGANLLDLAPPERAQFKDAHERLAIAFALDEAASSRDRARTIFQSEIRAFLSDEQYRRYEKLVSDRVTDWLMGMY